MFVQLKWEPYQSFNCNCFKKKNIKIHKTNNDKKKFEVEADEMETEIIHSRLIKVKIKAKRSE